MTIMMTLVQLLEDNEEWLMRRVLEYARESGYTAYTSTLLEAWRLSISGLSGTIIAAAKAGVDPPAILADEALTEHPLSQFGLVEAKKHQDRGISLTMFFGLLKYYRRTYLEVIDSNAAKLADYQGNRSFFTRVFDIIEAGIVVGWAGGDKDQIVYRLQLKNREMTNEKNKYLTIFESIPNPAFLISANGEIDTMNFAAARLLDVSSVSGADYYRSSVSADNRANRADVTIGQKQRAFREVLPWITQEMEEFYRRRQKETVFEKEVNLDQKRHVFRVKIAQMLDVSRRFDGIVLILEDITSLKDAQEKVKTLEGFIPICSHCKKMREDDGYWSRVEEYLEKRSGVLFTHSICDECVKKYYSHLSL